MPSQRTFRVNPEEELGVESGELILPQCTSLWNRGKGRVS